MVVNETETLKGLIEMAIERHQTSARQLAFKAQEAGFKIVYTTINQIRNGIYKSKPSEVTLKAIAYLAGVEESVAFAAAGQPVPGPPLADELPPGADNLSPKSRKAVVEMVRVLVDLESSTNAQRTPESNDTPPRLRAVAPEGDARSRQKIDSLTPEEIRLVTTRENRRLRREESNYITGMTQAHAYADSLREQGKSPQEVREALTAMRESLGEELAELRAAGKAIEKEETAKIKSQGGNVSGYARHGSITELHGAEARSIPVPERDQLAAKRGVKTRREQLDEETGARDVHNDEGK